MPNNPEMKDYKDLRPFRFWCQTVLPTVYDDSLSYYELLNKVVSVLNDVIDNESTVENNVTELYNAFVELNTFVDTYFDDLDVTEEINNKLDTMAEDGTLARLLAEYVYTAPTYAENISQMTDHSTLYINGQDGYIYRWSGTAWISTGILYNAPVINALFAGRIANGYIGVKLVPDSEDENSCTVSVIGTENNCRIIGRDGAIYDSLAGRVFTLEIDSLNYTYVCLNTASGTLEAVSFRGNIYDTKYTVLFGVYRRKINELNIPLMDYDYPSTFRLNDNMKVPIPRYPADPDYYAGKLLKGFVSATLYEDNGKYVKVTTQPSSILILADGNAYNLGNSSIENNIFIGDTNNYRIIVFDTEANEFVLDLTGLRRNKQRYPVIFGVYQNRICNYEIPITNSDYSRYLAGSETIPETLSTTGSGNVLFNGYIFVWCEGTNVRAKCTRGARCSINGASIDLSNREITEAFPATNCSLVINSSGDFDFVVTGSVTENDMVIATCTYRWWSTPYPDFVFCNTVNIFDKHTIYQHGGSMRYCFNFSRLGYRIRLQHPKDNNNIKDFGEFIQIVNGYNSSNGLEGYFAPIYGSPEYVPNQFSFDTNVLARNTDLGGKKIMFIGDSISNRGWIQRDIANVYPTVEFVGTKESGENVGIPGYMTEAYPGWSTTTMLGSTSPFYNPNSQSFDFGYYVGAHAIIPDIVIIEFGLNESVSGDIFCANVQTMINSIHAYNSSIPVYIVMPFRRRIGAHNNNYATNEQNIRRQRDCMLSCYALTNCTLIPTWFCLNDNLDYVYVDMPYNLNGLTVRGCNDNIHPAELTGFKQLSHMIMSYI